MSKEKKALEEMLEGRKDNLIRLHFDRYFGGIMYEKEKVGLNKSLETINADIKAINEKLDAQRQLSRKMKNIEQITKLENKLRGGPLGDGLLAKKAVIEGQLAKMLAEVIATELSINISEQMIKVLKDCINNNPKQIYEWRNKKENDKKGSAVSDSK